MENGNGGINGKRAINTIGSGEIIGGKYISFPKSSLKGNYYILFIYIYIYLGKIFMYHMTYVIMWPIWLFLIGLIMAVAD